MGVGGGWEMVLESVVVEGERMEMGLGVVVEEGNERGQHKRSYQ